MKRILVMGAGGFIGGHLMRALKEEDPENLVVGIDCKMPEFNEPCCDAFLLGNLVDPDNVAGAVTSAEPDEVYQLAADMGGAGYIFSGDHDADIMAGSSLINIHLARCAVHTRKPFRVFYSSSACIYPQELQMHGQSPTLSEYNAYPANPDSEYGWEKLFSERLYAAHARNHGLVARVARYHNIFGPLGTWRGGREKAPAAICRKVAQARPGGSIEVWGDGEQTRSFLYVDECVEGTIRLMRSSVEEPLNIGSDESISINGLVQLVCDIANKHVNVNHVPGPLGVRGRNSNNTLIKEKLGWAPSAKLRAGLEKTYAWVEEQVRKEN